MCVSGGLKLFLMACAALLAGPGIVFGDNGLLSSIYGLGALNQIASDSELRNKISITDSQLSEIRAVLSNKKLFVGDESENNAVGKSYLRKILSRVQADLLRIEIVKSRLAIPTNFFMPNLLRELGLNELESMRIHSECAKLESRVAAESDKRRVEAINAVLPTDAQPVFWKFVGRSFQLDSKAGKLDEINAFLKLTPLQQISQAAYMEVPQSLAYSAQQRDQISKLSDKVHRDQVDGINYTLEELEAMLDGILTQAQRVAIVQSINRSCVRSDLIFAVRPQLATVYDLSESDLATMTSKLAQAQKDLKEWEAKKLLEACRTCLREVPIEGRTAIKSLSAGIWEL